MGRVLRSDAYDYEDVPVCLASLQFLFSQLNYTLRHLERRDHLIKQEVLAVRDELRLCLNTLLEVDGEIPAA